jgi:predicted ArsR family transcriptional regulator
VSKIKKIQKFSVKVQTQRRGRGRPEHTPDRQSRQAVEQLVAARVGHRQIAYALGITHKTLEKHYQDELLNGVARKQKEVMAMLYRSAKGGNVSAQRKLYAIVYGETNNAEEKPAKKLGKKEQLHQDAKEVSAKFAPPTPPKLIVNNS